MITRFPRRSALRILTAAAILAVVGCTAAPTAPVARHVQAGGGAHRDDIPTDPCRSGWVIENGKWVCPDI